MKFEASARGTPDSAIVGARLRRTGELAHLIVVLAIRESQQFRFELRKGCGGLYRELAYCEYSVLGREAAEKKPQSPRN